MYGSIVGNISYFDGIDPMMTINMSGLEGRLYNVTIQIPDAVITYNIIKQ